MARNEVAPLNDGVVRLVQTLAVPPVLVLVGVLHHLAAEGVEVVEAGRLHGPGRAGVNPHVAR